MIVPEVLILLLAILLDQLLGEPPSAIHPVVWIGKAISLLEKLSPRTSVARLAYGAFMVVFVVLLFALPTFYVLQFLKSWNLVAYVIAGAFVLKTNFALRELRQAAMRVFSSLNAGQLDSARQYLRHLVSRNTDSLDEPLIVAATLESVAENVTDSFLAPVLFFALFGVPGAVAYRAINTLDSMVGYHGEYEYLGKTAAKLDDALNIIPSRIAGVLTVLASVFGDANLIQAWHIMMRDHALTESPNAGWTMSAMSGALGVQLEKVGHYRLGDPVAELSPLKIPRAVTIMYVVAGLALLISLLVEVVVHAYLA